jgi:hypothetical protein
MLEEMERRKQEQLEEARRREVRILLILLQIRICPNPNPGNPNPDDYYSSTDDSVRVSVENPQKLISLEDDYHFS